VRDNEIWKLEQKDGDILPALKLSYDQMPSHLKAMLCLMFSFPKGLCIDSDELIAFWMAHGLLNKTPNNSQNLELEDVGDMYIKELWSKSFFQDVQNSFWYFRSLKCTISSMILHSRLHKKSASIVDFHTQNIVGTVRHLSFSHNNGTSSKYFSTLSSGVRTTLFPSKQQVPTLVEACISRFKCLRVLRLKSFIF
jgi:hypothetical protein